MKGIILAGGSATRIRPITDVISKQLLPIYDKPMIYYPLSILMLAEIRDILIIVSPEYENFYKNLLGDGKRFGIHIDYKVQEKPNGLAEAFIIGEEFINNESCVLILGDNILWGSGLEDLMARAMKNLDEGFATVFCWQVEHPDQFGVAWYDLESGIVTQLVEKPQPQDNPVNNAVIGLYFYDNNVCSYAKKLEPSSRGELEITDLNKIYMNQQKLKAINLNDDVFKWSDAGSFDGLFDAANYVRTKQSSGTMIAVPDEIAFKKKWITKIDLLNTAEKYQKSSYGVYLKEVAQKKQPATKKKAKTIKKVERPKIPNLFGNNE